MSVTVVMAGDRLRGDGETKQGRRSVKSSAPCCSHGVNGGHMGCYVPAKPTGRSPSLMSQRPGVGQGCPHARTLRYQKASSVKMVWL